MGYPQPPPHLPALLLAVGLAVWAQQGLLIHCRRQQPLQAGSSRYLWSAPGWRAQHTTLCCLQACPCPCWLDHGNRGAAPGVPTCLPACLLRARPVPLSIVSPSRLLVSRTCSDGTVGVSLLDRARRRASLAGPQGREESDARMQTLGGQACAYSSPLRRTTGSGEPAARGSNKGGAGMYGAVVPAMPSGERP